jgi:hypothetical protein
MDAIAEKPVLAARAYNRSTTLSIAARERWHTDIAR